MVIFCFVCCSERKRGREEERLTGYYAVLSSPRTIRVFSWFMKRRREADGMLKLLYYLL